MDVLINVHLKHFVHSVLAQESNKMYERFFPDDSNMTNNPWFFFVSNDKEVNIDMAVVIDIRRLSYNIY